MNKKCSNVNNGYSYFFICQVQKDERQMATLGEQEPYARPHDKRHSRSDGGQRDRLGRSPPPREEGVRGTRRDRMEKHDIREDYPTMERSKKIGHRKEGGTRKEVEDKGGENNTRMVA